MARDFKPLITADEKAAFDRLGRDINAEIEACIDAVCHLDMRSRMESIFNDVRSLPISDREKYFADGVALKAKVPSPTKESINAEAGIDK